MTATKYVPNESIEVYDNVFSVAKQFDIQLAVKKSMYKFGWNDNPDSQPYLYSQWSPDNLNSIKFFSSFNQDHPLHEKIDPDRFLRCVVNCDVSSNVHWTHTHIEENVLLYYVNTEWKDEWGGETLFFDRAGNEIVYGSRFTPNRMIWFDGEIPHTIKPQSRKGPDYRFSISIFFKKHSPSET